MKYLKKSAKFYDLTQGVSDFVNYSKFVAKILKKYKVENVLELGCGTGLYLIPLKEYFDIEGLDLSKDMLEVASSKDSKLRLYHQDMSKFKVDNKFDAIICMNSSLLLLPSVKHFDKTFKKVNEHLKPEGIFILDVADVDVEIKNWNFTQDESSYEIPRGKVDIIRRDYKTLQGLMNFLTKI